jgi:CxxC-x17-CxxC domain-containing protein
MEPVFVDRILICSDCHGEFIFTAGEQLFFFDKQFKNDPKRCKPCKSRRSGLSAAANGATPGPAAAGLSRTETRTECSECGVQTTVPFKPTQGRPVLCRQCFQVKAKAATAPRPAEPTPGEPVAMTLAPGSETASALTEASANSLGATLSPDAAVVAAASMAAASPQSSVATAADLASITPVSVPVAPPSPIETAIPAALVAESMQPDMRTLAAESPEA